MSRSKQLAVALGALLGSMSIGSAAFAQSGMQYGGMQNSSKQNMQQMQNMQDQSMMNHGKTMGHDDMSRMWDAMDTDHDDYISASEHAAYADSMFKKADTNGDGKLSQEECRNAMMKMHHGSMNQTDFTQTWNSMDMDHDGSISQSEHAAYMDAMFKKADSNSDGKLSKDEMKAAMQAMHHDNGSMQH